MSNHDIITEINDPLHVLGKQFSFTAEGKIGKKSAVSISVAIAIQHHVPDVVALEQLLARVSEDSHAAIINAAFPLIAIGQPFLLMSEDEFAKHGINRHDKSVQWPVKIDYAGKDWLALGRFKEQTAPSSWQLLDRDIDEHTPPHFAALDNDGWLAEVDKLLPGISKCARLRVQSSSARVSVAGVIALSYHGVIVLLQGDDMDALTFEKKLYKVFGVWPFQCEMTLNEARQSCLDSFVML